MKALFAAAHESAVCSHGPNFSKAPRCPSNNAGFKIER